MKKNIVSFVFVLILIGAYSSSYAQHRMDWSGPWGIGFGLGTASYVGDLNEPNGNKFLVVPQSLGFAGHGFFSKGFGPVTAMLQMNLGRLQSRDYVGDQKFKNSFYEYTGILRLNINHLIKGSLYRRDKWNVYVQGGYGMMRFSSYLTHMDEELINDYGYSSIGKAKVMLAGAGVSYFITREASFHLGADYHLFSGDGGDLVDAKVGGSSNDHYIYMHLGLSFDFGGASRHRGGRRSLLWGKF